MPTRLLLIVLVALAFPLRAPAWHKDGHMAVARIAWRELGDKEKVKIAKLLRAHIQGDIDHYKVFLSANRPTIDGEMMDEIEWAFVQAATWPDWVRDPKEQTPTLTKPEAASIHKQFHQGPWHFVNLPFVHPSDADVYDAAALAALKKQALVPEFKKVDGKDQPRHALAALKQSLEVLRSDAKDADKAVALCWVLHLVGDLHQPLHASALIARAESLPKTKFDPPPAAFAPPEGDAGGNRLAIKLKPEEKNARPLHAYWDSLVFNDAQKYSVVEEKVKVLVNMPNYKADKLPELAKTEFLDWAEESLEWATSVAYRENGTKDSAFLKATPLPTGLSKIEMEKALHDLDALVLSAAYQQAAKATAERRTVVAGYRLAAQLKKVLAD